MEAKRILMAERPQVLVADVRLGEFNGIQLLMLGKSVTPGLRAVITNATADRVLADETHRLGATFMIKPLDCRDLLRAVDNTTRHRAESTRHVMDRRLTLLPHFGPEHRFGERRVEARVNRRAGDRRRVIMPILFPDRRLAERRRST